MLYLDYARRDPGEVDPELRFGGHENLEAVEFLKQASNLAKFTAITLDHPERSPRSRRRGRGSPGPPTSAASASG